MTALVTANIFIISTSLIIDNDDDMFSQTFSLRNPNSKTETTVFLNVTYRGKRVRLSTKEKVIPALWNQKERRITKSSIRIEQIENRHSGSKAKMFYVQTRLDEISMKVSGVFLKYFSDQSYLDIDHLKVHLKRIIESEGLLETEDRVTEFLTSFIADIRKGLRKKSNGFGYKKGSIVCYQNLLNTIHRYERYIRKTLTWSNIDKSMYSLFLRWHEDHGYSVNYTGRHVKELKSIMRLAYEDGLHANDAFRKRWFSVPKEVIKKIPLSRDEVERIFNLDLSSNLKLQISRDVFIIGCYTGLRVSDLRRVTSDDIYKDDNGSYLSLRTIKTGQHVEIPLSQNVMVILNRYDYTMPKFVEQVINRHIKILASKIGIRKDRALKLSIHYSRATFAKLSYEMGVPSLYIMRVTGHTSEKNFLRYVNIAPQEAMNEFRKHDYFK